MLIKNTLILAKNYEMISNLVTREFWQSFRPTMYTSLKVLMGGQSESKILSYIPSITYNLLSLFVKSRVRLASE